MKNIFFCGTANKKAKLITTTATINNHYNNNSNGKYHDHIKYRNSNDFNTSENHVVKSYTPVEDQQQYYTQQNHHDLTRPGSSSSSCGPKLVNKQLVLPFVPPSFPHSSPDGVNHLIKPSEYLKSITDKKSNAGSTRWVFVTKIFFK